METEATIEQQTTAAKKPGSGYARLRNRHHSLIAEHEQLAREHQELLDAQVALQGDIDRLLAEHQRLMKSIKSPGQAPWFQSANQVLAQLAIAPEPRALQVMTAALAGLQQRLAQIIMRVPGP